MREETRDRISDAPVRSVTGRKETLLRIGERLFAQHGYRDISIKDITSAAGLGMGSFYTYFPSKEEFYSGIIDLIEQRGMRDIERYISGLHSPLFQLKALYRYTTLSLRNNAILRGIYSGEKRFMYPGLEERASRGTTLFARVESLLDRILKEGTRKGVFRTSLFRNPRRLLIAMFTALPLSVHGASAEDLTEDVMMLIERGLKRWLRFRQRDERLDKRARRRAL